MKSILLLALRATTGALLIIWGTIKAMEPARSVRISDGLYGGTLSAEALQVPLGIAEIGLGVLVVAGLFRAITYPAQAAVLIIGALPLWKYLIDPLGAWLLTVETRQYLFFPTTTIVVATLILIAFKEYDTLSLDRMLRKK